MAANIVVVNIYGEDYPITGVTDAAHISRVADFVNARMQQIAQSSRVKARDKVAILAAMQIASELLEKSEQLESTLGQVEGNLDSLLDRLDRELAPVSDSR
ncbi:MAG TPA: cell division protein ZapA [candidate division Zixibacteria bacterium]|nr:cell division protein ZapA [candidate division Zixibacteria bacterium]MDD4917176.1 cell division protein ZapA [candidate division Zixibacteria bacterium]MDM7971642.1 cell division protein ZapA [candidate division Zixibacteria bacterium]HOD65818.1 cell division protein ZapA [candidate division Zixibacteria bacterium]HPM36117.1 cell division protein ZapA [candidate division Zixibacteria bacterium]